MSYPALGTVTYSKLPFSDALSVRLVAYIRAVIGKLTYEKLVELKITEVFRKMSQSTTNPHKVP
jgi:hypothetical protein